MARGVGNPNLWKHGFKKGDPRINRKGAPKKLPQLKRLMKVLLGVSVEDAGDLSKSRMAKIIEALISETTNKKIGAQRVAAAKEVLDRAYGKVTDASNNVSSTPIIWKEEKTYQS